MTWIAPRRFAMAAMLGIFALSANLASAAMAAPADEAFIAQCSRETSVGSALQCVCVDQEINRRYDGVQRQFVQSLFMTGVLTFDEDPASLSDEDQQSLVESGDRIAKECGVTLEE